MCLPGTGLIGSACCAMKRPETAPSQPLPKVFQGLFNGQWLTLQTSPMLLVLVEGTVEAKPLNPLTPFFLTVR